MDMNQIRHDLAVAYVQSKIQIALARGELGRNADEAIEAAQDMASWYKACMEELAAIKDERLADPLWMD